MWKKRKSSFSKKMKTRRVENSEEVEVPSNRTVVVGMQLDPLSNELLTWTLVKIAQPGDRVLALHVLLKNESLDRDGQLSLLSLVKAFDSVLAVYDGFCNLKQVELKLKICRGSSVRKILVREAKSCSACKVILGVEKSARPIWPSASVAKYCARKLPLHCGVVAVKNGKVLFQREAADSCSGSNGNGRRNSPFWCAFHRAFSSAGRTSERRLLECPSTEDGDCIENEDDQQCSRDSFDSVSGVLCAPYNKIPSKRCSICAPFLILHEESLCHSAPESPCSEHYPSNDGLNVSDSMALVPLQDLRSSSSSVSFLIREVAETRPGWPSLQRTSFSGWQGPGEDINGQISMLQWAMKQLRSGHPSAIGGADNISVNKQANTNNIEQENGALILSGGPETHNFNCTGKEELMMLQKELALFCKKYSSMCRLFNYEELMQATSNFASGHLIGKGGSSKVYRGCLPDGKELAVKFLKPSQDALSEFISEIEIITTISHKNVISLCGFCFETSALLMAYDFLPRGSLEESLHGEKDKPDLGWAERRKVALGIAEALNYLHTRPVQPVIHGDVKSSNILLDDDFEPQLSDFGLAKWASTSTMQTTYTDVAGTFGYLAPEYFMYGKVTDKIDVYAFGVVLLELLSAKKPICHENPRGYKSLVMWAQPILRNGKYRQLLDPNLDDVFDDYGIETMALAALLCIRRSPRCRPRIGLILKLLHGDEEMAQWARLQVSSLEEFDGLEEDSIPISNIQSHLNLALLDVEEDSLSTSSTEPNVHCLTSNKSLEDYLQGRWSRSSSFD